MARSWTLSEYGELCLALLEAGYRIQTVRTYLESPARPGAILRHDVDRFPANALRMAQVEKDLGVQATYYVRMVPAVYDPQLIMTLHNQRHEVGYHYEVLAKTQGDVAQALRLMADELAAFREWVPVYTACAHGSPLSRWDNLAIWRHSQPAEFGLLGEPFLNIDYAQVAYFTDTGRAWDATSTNLRDRVHQGQIEFPRVHTTDELIALIRRSELPLLCIQTHPERWNESRVRWLRSAILDWAANGAKLAISFLRLIDQHVTDRREALNDD